MSTTQALRVDAAAGMELDVARLRADFPILAREVNGKVRVRHDAQKTDSRQSSRNLLLSEKARVVTKPELQIDADDVKCAHGATVGQLDMDEVFYLQSRGLSQSAARSLLTFAFAAEIIDQLPVASLHDSLRQWVIERMHVEILP